jgi:hypothetical protein
MFMAAAITVAPTAGIPRNSANPTSSAPKVAGSIPRTPGPSVGNGNSVHPYVSDVNQGHQKKMLNKITSVTAAAVVGIATTVAGAQSAAVQWRVEDGGNGHWYRTVVTTSAVTWTAAANAASDAGSHLATLNSDAENRFVYLLARSQDGWNGFYFGPWIGGYAEAGMSECDTNSWRWITGEPWDPTATTWCPSQPDCGGETRLHYWYCTNGWNNLAEHGDYGWGAVTAYVAEWEADCNSDGIVDYGQCLNGTLPDYNSNNTPDCCERGEVCVVGNYPVQWRVEDGGNGHWYAIDTSRRTWTGADTNAATRGGHLLTVTSYAEHTFLRSSVFTYCCSMSDTWMGAVRSSTTENYHWVTGEPFSTIPEIYFNNNSVGWDAPALYLEQVIRFSWVGEWGGESNSANEGNFSVIEWSADCNNDGTVDYGQILRGELPDINHSGTPDTCECIGDIDVDGIVNGGDLGTLLAYWGPTTSAATSIACDLNVDGVVNGSDLGILLAYWGPCSN